MPNPNAGPLESAGVHVKEDTGNDIKKNIEAAKALLDSIGSMPPKSDDGPDYSNISAI